MTFVARSATLRAELVILLAGGLAVSAYQGWSLVPLGIAAVLCVISYFVHRQRVLVVTGADIYNQQALVCPLPFDEISAMVTFRSKESGKMQPFVGVWLKDSARAGVYQTSSKRPVPASIFNRTLDRMDVPPLDVFIMLSGFDKTPEQIVQVLRGRRPGVSDIDY